MTMNLHSAEADFFLFFLLPLLLAFLTWTSFLMLVLLANTEE